MKYNLKFNKKMIVLVGNIGTGKTTLCQKLVKQGYEVISKDAIRYMLGGGKYIFDTRLEASVMLSEKDLLLNFTKLGANIIVDDCNISQRLRKHTITIGKSNGYHITAYILPRLTMKECVDRRMVQPHDQNDRKVWERVWQNFEMAYEIPSIDEGFDKIIHMRKLK